MGMILDRAGSGASPLYAKKLHGMAVRGEYQEAGGEAAALTRSAPAAMLAGFGQGQAIRDNARNAARGQTVLHYQIRQQMAEDEDRAAAMRDDRVRAYAELALRGQMANVDAELKRRGLDLESQQVDQQGNYQQGQLENQQAELGLRGDELDMRGQNAIEDRKLEQAKLAADQRKTTQQGSAQAAEIGLRQQELGIREKEMKQRGAIEDRRSMGSLTRAYTGDSVQRYMESNDPADLEPREKAKSAKAFKPGAAFNRARALGIDTSSFTDEEGKRTQDARDFVDVVNQLRSENPDWDNDKVLRSAAGDMGLSMASGTSGGKTAAAAKPAGDPPVPGAVFDAKLNAWVVQQDGKWKKVAG